MSRPAPTDPRLRASPAFVLAHAMDGRPYVAQETEPYTQYWISERERLVLGAFSGRHGARVGEALDTVQRGLGRPRDVAERARLHRAMEEMTAAGVLLDAAADTSRYDRRIVAAYVEHRPFPQAVADAIVAQGGLGRSSRVLDLAGGPGDLALRLARVSDHVTLMDLSRGFVAAARARAREAGLKLEAVHDSANRLVHRDDELDAVTVSQALHWLDDVQVCRGLCRVLRPGGSFFVVHAGIELPDEHPLAYVFGWNSILGRKRRQPFAREVAPLHKRLALLFDALDAPDVDRHELSRRTLTADAKASARIVPAAVTLFRERRAFGAGFARAFLTDRHIAVTGRSPAEFWRDLDSRVAGADAARLQGTMHWALLQYRRGGRRLPAGPASAWPTVTIC